MYVDVFIYIYTCVDLYIYVYVGITKASVNIKIAVDMSPSKKTRLLLLMSHGQCRRPPAVHKRGAAKTNAWVEKKQKEDLNPPPLPFHPGGLPSLLYAGGKHTRPYCTQVSAALHGPAQPQWASHGQQAPASEDPFLACPRPESRSTLPMVLQDFVSRSVLIIRTPSTQALPEDMHRVSWFGMTNAIAIQS